MGARLCFLTVSVDCLMLVEHLPIGARCCSWRSTTGAVSATWRTLLSARSRSRPCAAASCTSEWVGGRIGGRAGGWAGGRVGAYGDVG